MVAALRDIIGLCVGEQDEVLPRGWMYWRSMHQSQCERGHCATLKRLAKYGSGSSKNQNSTIHFVYCKQLAVSIFHKWLETPREGSWRRHKCPVDFPDRLVQKSTAPRFTNTSPLISSNTVTNTF